ncbi:hypothetical protein EV44_g2290 [Erysiphe necator]|uniref:Uncharacterized protein n=1 Tax=Uncinula necator TaxID=52586 RepID=A0A0B1P8T4_UNCNE|nr:hypothetical protein EV44_g2290 [Erysiphe necator]
MKSLNTSLPGMPPTKQQDPPEQLLAAFKAAALSVTNLYKSAVSNQGGSRLEGYQSAIDELLTFLDRENLGLSDGEGWMIRRWATERLDGRDSTSHNTESEDEGDKTDRGSSPISRSNSSNRVSQSTQSTTRAVSPVRRDLNPTSTPSLATTDDNTNNLAAPVTAFTFQAQYPYPRDADIFLADIESESSHSSNLDSSIISHNSLQASSLALPRLPRSRSSHPSRLNSKSTGPLGKGVGQKRKINYGDFFDIGNAGYGKENFGGGGKRGRFA